MAVKVAGTSPGDTKLNIYFQILGRDKIMLEENKRHFYKHRKQNKFANPRPKKLQVSAQKETSKEKKKP